MSWMSQGRNSFSSFKGDKLFCLPGYIAQYLCSVDVHFAFSWRHKRQFLSVCSLCLRDETSKFKQNSFQRQHLQYMWLVHLVLRQCHDTHTEYVNVFKSKILLEQSYLNYSLLIFKTLLYISLWVSFHVIQTFQKVSFCTESQKEKKKSLILCREFIFRKCENFSGRQRPWRTRRQQLHRQHRSLWPRPWLCPWGRGGGCQGWTRWVQLWGGLHHRRLLVQEGVHKPGLLARRSGKGSLMRMPRGRHRRRS